MTTVLIYIVALVVVGGLLFLAASFAFGRDEEMAPVLPEGTPVQLPDDRLAGGDDLRALRLSVVLRGYRMEEVDWVLDLLAEQVETRDREIARLRSVLHVEPVVPDGSAGPADAVGSMGAGSAGVVGTPGRSGIGGSSASTFGTVRRAGPDWEPELLTHPAPERRGLDPVEEEQRRRVGPGDPVRGLRPDGVPEREQR